MDFSFTKIVRGKSKAEAKKKAWARFLKRVPKKYFSIYADEI